MKSYKIKKNYKPTFFLWLFTAIGMGSWVCLLYEQEVFEFHLIPDKNLLPLFFIAVLLTFISLNMVIIFSSYKKNDNIENLKFSFIDNSILLTLNTIHKNGYKVIWEQISKESKQIHCFNEHENDFKAFDKYIWSDENNAVKKEVFSIRYPMEEIGVVQGPVIEMKATELWTPIELKFTNEWLKENIASENIKNRKET